MLLQRIVLVSIVWVYVMSAISCAPMVGGSGRRRHRRQRRETKNSTSETIYDSHPKSKRDDPYSMPPNMNSDFVLFSSEKPISPPWRVAMTTDEETEHLAEYSEHSVNSTATNSRVKRSFRKQVVRFSICDTVSDWVERTTAHDMWGNEVQVAQKINMGRSTVNQYFYETYCRHNKTPCTGIDTTRFYSACETKHIWVYARIINRIGEEGWNLVKIRGSCNCALYSRTDRPPSIMDYLDRAGR